MPSFVRTASVYVDNVASPEEATAAVEALNSYIVEVNILSHDVHIVLPDNNDTVWEPTGNDEDACAPACPACREENTPDHAN